MKKVNEYNQFVRSLGIIQQDLLATNININNCWRVLSPKKAWENYSHAIERTSPQHISAGAKLFSETTRAGKEIELFAPNASGIYDSTKINLTDLEKFITTINEIFHKNTQVLSLLNNPVVDALPKNNRLILIKGTGREAYFQAEDFTVPADTKLSIEDKFFRTVVNFEKFYLGLAELQSNLYIALLNSKLISDEMASFLKLFSEDKKWGVISQTNNKEVYKILVDHNNFEFLRVMKMCANILNELDLAEPESGIYNLYLLKDRKKISNALLSLVKICGEALRGALYLEYILVIKT